MKKFLLLLFILGLGAFVFFAYQPEPEIAKEEGQILVEEEKEEPIAEPKEEALEVSLSSYFVRQGDTLAILIESSSNPEFLYEGEGMRVGELNGKYLALIPFDTRSALGPRSFLVRSGENEEEFSFEVVDRDFPVTEIILSQTQKEKGETPATVVSNIVKNDKPTLDEILAIRTENLLFSGPFISPVLEWKNVGGFGNERSSGGYSIRHLGIDLDGSTGDPVFASNDGEVVYRDTLPSFGKSIVIDHGQGIFTLYLHLNDYNVSLGDFVGQGETIGFVGNTGDYSLEPHLHFSVKVRGVSVDPEQFLDLDFNSTF